MTDKVQKIREEVERIMEACLDENGNPITYGEDCAYARLCELKEYIDSLQEEPINEDKDLEETINTIKLLTSNTALLTFEYGFRKGAKWQKEQMMKDATDVTVHVDAGGYPYIPEIELYDYEKDIPLAKEGDKYNVVLIKKD